MLLSKDKGDDFANKLLHFAENQPFVSDKAPLLEVPYAKTTMLANNTEQFFIHLLERQFLLNVQPGGSFHSFQPSVWDLQAVRKLKLDLNSSYLPCNDSIDSIKTNIKKAFQQFCPGFHHGANQDVLDMSIHHLS
ncbi:hypothetical protein BC940DRAFT_367212 [Gongronella butleri]|nr:hypothetical protein BC940DRAFT_367212 [Gongronella butleri]